MLYITYKIYCSALVLEVGVLYRWRSIKRKLVHSVVIRIMA